jgi:hypothetical protein
MTRVSWGTRLGKHLRRMFVASWILVASADASCSATELKQQAAAAFAESVRATEARMAENVFSDQFLAVDRLPNSVRQISRMGKFTSKK